MVGGGGRRGGGYLGLQVTGMIERVFLNLKFSIPGCFWVAKLANVFLGFFGIQYNMKVRGSARISRPRGSVNKIQPNKK